MQGASKAVCRKVSRRTSSELCTSHSKLRQDVVAYAALSTSGSGRQEKNWCLVRIGGGRDPEHRPSGPGRIPRVIPKYLNLLHPTVHPSSMIAVVIGVVLVIATYY